MADQADPGMLQGYPALGHGGGGGGVQPAVDLGQPLPVAGLAHVPGELDQGGLVVRLQLEAAAMGGDGAGIVLGQAQGIAQMQPGRAALRLDRHRLAEAVGGRLEAALPGQGDPQRLQGGHGIRGQRQRRLEAAHRLVEPAGQRQRVAQMMMVLRLARLHGGGGGQPIAGGGDLPEAQGGDAGQQQDRRLPRHLGQQILGHAGGHRRPPVLQGLGRHLQPLASPHPHRSPCRPAGRRRFACRPVGRRRFGCQPAGQRRFACRPILAP